MNDRTKTFWVPGLVSLTASMGWRFILQSTVGPVPQTLVNHAGLPLRQQLFWLAALPFFGAASAYLSRRAGGDRRVAVLAAVLPSAVMVPLWIGMGINMAHPSPAQWFGLLSGILNWIVLPAIALLLGALPFFKARLFPDWKFNTNPRIATLWVPAFLSFITAMAFLTVTTFVGLQSRFVARNLSLLVVYVPWLLLLPLCGATGAYFSRRAGGGRTARLFAGLFPVIAMTSLIGFLMFLGRFAYAEPRSLYFCAAVLMGAILPGIALLSGTLPFLKASVARP
jgi:hypothetical protein